MSMHLSKFKNSKRNRSGYALVSVMLISLVASMLLMSLAGLSVGLLRTEGVARQREYSLAGAEAGLDYAKFKLTESLTTGLPADIAPEGEQLFKDYGLPVQYIPQLGNRCQVMIRVTRILPAEFDWASENSSPSIPDSVNSEKRKDDSLWRFGDDWQQFAIADPEQAPNKSYCWKVEVTSYCGAFATSVRSILIGSNFVDAAPTSPPTSNAPAVVANDGISMDAYGDVMSVQANVSGTDAVDQVFEDSGNNTFRASLKSNGSFSLGSVDVEGNLVASNPEGASNSFLSGSSASRINGRIETNLVVDGDGNEISPTNGLTGTDGNTAGNNDNVLANADLSPYGNSVERLNDNTMPIQRKSGVDQNFSQAPISVSSPSNASPFPGFPMTPPDPTSTVQPLTTVPAGQTFRAESLDTSLAQTPLQFESSVNNPTKIFVDDPAYVDPQNPGHAIDLNTSMFRTGQDSNGLQIFYSGKRPVRMVLDPSNPNLKLTLFAPYADVLVESAALSNNIGSFVGGIVGKTVSVSRLQNFRLDPTSAQTLSLRLRTRFSSTDDEKGVKPTSYKVVSWQQLNGSIVPLQ